MCTATISSRSAAARTEFLHSPDGAGLLGALLARPIGSRITAVAEPAPAADPAPAVVAAAITPARATRTRTRRPRAERAAPPPAVVAPVAPAPRRADYEAAQTVSMVLLPSQRAAMRREPAPVAEVAAPAPRRAAPAPQKAAPAPAVVAAPVASRSPRRQKLATVGIGPGRYAFSYLGKKCEVARTPAGDWFLTIDGRPGSRRYETKRHAVNAARLFIEGAAAAPAPVAAQEAAAVAAAPTAPRDWRNDPATPKQLMALLGMVKKLAARGLSPVSPLAKKAGLTKGEASEFIDSLKSQLCPTTAGNGAGGKIETCAAGPFARGRCLVCGLPQSR